MNTNRDAEKAAALLEAVFKDESWQASCANLKGQALGQFRAQRRRRRIVAAMGSVLAIIGLGLCATLVLMFQRDKGASVATGEAVPPISSLEQRLLTDDQLLNLFPKGTCVLAEVDGKKE